MRSTTRFVPFKITYNSFVFCQLWELFFSRISVCQKNFDNCFGETFHVAFPYLRIGTFQFRNNIKTLSELSENINHWCWEESVLTAPLELYFRIKREIKKKNGLIKWTTSIFHNKLVNTPSCLSRLNAPCRYSNDTSSFSFNHCITNGSNQLRTTHEIRYHYTNCFRSKDCEGS